MMHNWRPSERLDSVLDRSIDRLDEEDPESILRDYPQSRNTLAPMLHIADALRDLEQVSMSPAAKQAGRERLRKAVLARQRRRPRSALANGMRMATWVAVFLFVCTGAIGGLTRASANTLPDEPLYSWKRTTERVWLGVQTTTERKITVSLALADRRVDEMKRLYQRSGRVYPAIINQLQVDYTRTLQLIDTLPPEQAQPLLAQAQAIGAEHEHELMQLAQQATGEEQQILLAAVQMSQWVQHTSPEQATASPPPAIPEETSAAPTDEPTVPSATTAPTVPGDKPQPTSPVAPPASEQPTPNNPSAQPGVPATPLPGSPATPLPATPKPTTVPQPPVRNPSAVPQPTRPARPAPTERVAPPRPTARPEPTPVPPTAVPAIPAPTDVQPGPPSNPPGNPTVQPGPPVDPPGNPTAQPGPPSNPPGNPTVQPGPPVDPPGQPTARPEPTVNPPGQPTAQPGPPIDPPGQNKTPKPTDPPKEEKTPRPTNQPGPPNNPPGNPTAQPGPPNDPPGNGQPGPPSNPPGNPTAQPGPPNDPPGKKK